MHGHGLALEMKRLIKLDQKQYALTSPFILGEGRSLLLIIQILAMEIVFVNGASVSEQFIFPRALL